MIKAIIKSNSADNIWLAKKHGEWDMTCKPSKLLEGDFVIITTSNKNNYSANILVQITEIEDIVNVNNQVKIDWAVKSGHSFNPNKLRCKLKFKHIFTLNPDEVKKYIEDKETKNFKLSQSIIDYKK